MHSAYGLPEKYPPTAVGLTKYNHTLAEITANRRLKYPIMLTLIGATRCVL